MKKLFLLSLGSWNHFFEEYLSRNLIKTLKNLKILIFRKLFNFMTSKRHLLTLLTLIKSYNQSLLSVIKLKLF